MRREVRNSISGKKKNLSGSLKYQKEGKGYLECAGEHETGENLVGKKPKKA